MWQTMRRKYGPEPWSRHLRNVLEYGCRKGMAGLVDQLLEAEGGADEGAGRLIFEKNKGFTLLHAAAWGGNERIVWALIDAGAKPDIDTKAVHDEYYSRTPLQLAVVLDHEAAAKALVAAGADMTGALGLAASTGTEGLACDLLLAGADPDDPYEDDEGDMLSPLELACRRGLDQLVRALLQKGAEKFPAAGMGYTLLHAAAGGGHASTAKILLGAGLELDHFSWDGKTPLHSAAKADSAAAVCMLVAAGADVRARHLIQGHGESPLHTAAGTNSIEAALALLWHGADIHAVDHSGLQPLHYACRELFVDMVDLLVSWGADETAAAGTSGPTAFQIVPSVEDIDDAINIHEERDDNFEETVAKRDFVFTELERGPYERAWRRRRFVLLCRAHPDRMRLEPAEVAAGTAVADGGRTTRATATGGGCDKLARREDAGGVGAGGAAATGGGAVVVAAATLGDGSEGVEDGTTGDRCCLDGVGAAWMIGLPEGIFRHIVTFL